MARVCYIGDWAAHLISAGDEIIVIGFELTAESVEAVAILVDELNRLVRCL